MLSAALSLVLYVCKYAVLSFHVLLDTHIFKYVLLVL